MTTEKSIFSKMLVGLICLIITVETEKTVQSTWLTSFFIFQEKGSHTQVSRLRGLFFSQNFSTNQEKNQRPIDPIVLCQPVPVFPRLAPITLPSLFLGFGFGTTVI